MVISTFTLTLPNPTYCKMVEQGELLGAYCDDVMRIQMTLLAPRIPREQLPMESPICQSDSIYRFPISKRGEARCMSDNSSHREQQIYRLQ